MIKVGIIGGAGYTAGELIRLLVNHPQAELAWVHSGSNAGAALSDVHSGLLGDTSMHFSGGEPSLEGIDVLFLCSGHGKSGEFWSTRKRPAGLRVIDLAQDFRDESNGYVYGLPEWQRSRIIGASSIANPGCFATAIQLALLPLASVGLLKGEVNITAITGSTGAGVKPSATTHFSWRSDNISVYKAFTHQHLIEIRRNLSLAQGGELPEINFVPMRGDFARGIFAAVTTGCPLDDSEAADLYSNFYADAAFTHVSAAPVDLKQVCGTNKCLIHTEKHGSKLLVCSVVDNLLKGASGQAVQNMNLSFGLPEDMGLKLKATAF